uniref:Uncharacterized protein n=1 Tax=Alexandrium monilatum TaxID=311494 RepID=A0A7S4T1S7_9DINO
MSSSSDSEAAPDGTSGSSGGEGASANPEDCRRCWWPGGPLAAAALAAQLCVLAFPLCLAEEARYERFLDYNELGHLPRARTRVYWRSTDLGCYLREAGALVTGTVFFTFEYFRIKRKKRWSGSMFAAHSRAYFLSVWVALNLQALRDTWFLFMPCAHCIVVPPSVQLRSVASECVDIVTLCAAFLFYGLVEDRLRLVEVGFNARLGSNMIRGLRYALLVIMLMGVTNGNFDLFHLVGNAPYWASGYLITAMIPLLASAVTFRAITVVRRPTLQETPGLSAYTQAEKAWACNSVASMRLALSLPMLTNAVCLLAQAITYGFSGNSCLLLLMDASSVLITALMEAIALFFVIGVFTEQRPAFEAEEGSVKEVIAARQCAGSEAWSAKVSALAGRSVSALSLLDFFERLGPNGETMPHFDPRRSTTGDVVRHAVVPLSRRGDAGLPYAELVRSGGAALPASMVTHTWGCCFAVLVAAVVADAMGLAEYGDVLAQLEEGHISQVRDRLEACGGGYAHSA